MQIYYLLSWLTPDLTKNMDGRTRYVVPKNYLCELTNVTLMSKTILVKKVSEADYSKHLNLNSDVFNTIEFITLNVYKVEEIIFLLFFDVEKVIGGIYFGKSGNRLMNPFSAPYGGFAINGSQQPSTLSACAISLINFITENSLTCSITFPANVNNDTFTKYNLIMQAVLIQHGFRVGKADLNFHITLDDTFQVKSKHRNEVKRGRLNGLSFEASEFEFHHFEKIYNLINDNHLKLGYGMSMTENDFLKTLKCAKIYQFSVTQDTRPVAGAICYLTRTNVMQLINWGDRVESRGKVSAMLYLFYNTVNWIRSNMPQVEVLDLGPARGDNGISEGLADFKLKIGGQPSLKLTLDYRL